MGGSTAARRRQLADLYQAGNEDRLLRRRRPRTRSKPQNSRIVREKETVRREKEKALYGSITDTLEFGQRRAWHYGYRNQTGLSGSGPLAAASRYGAKGTLRMVRREASAARAGTAPEEDPSAEGFQVDEWSPMLRCSTSPSLATMTTPKAWPESAMYPHGAGPKRMQPSPWYDGETTANDVRAATAGAGMKRVAANHSHTMSVLRLNASIENAAEGMVARSTPSGGISVRPASAGSGQTARSKTAHVRTRKRSDQELGFLSGGTTYITAAKDPLTHCWTGALEDRLVRQTERDGLKWSLLKQILKVVTGSQRSLPLEAVRDVAARFGAAVGTSKLASQAQFIDHITGSHVGFPESELIALFGFFRSSTIPPAVATATSLKQTHQGGHTGGSVRLCKYPRSMNAVQGADWTVAVACLRLLAKPKESVLEAILGVFEVFALARGERIRHQQRLVRERKEEEGQREMEIEREQWKRRRRREEAMVVATGEEKNFVGFEPHAATVMPAAPGPPKDASSGDSDNRPSFAETIRMFTLVCSNERERHAVTTTYRHRFRLELKAVMQEYRSPYRFEYAGKAGGASSGGGDRSGSCESAAVVTTMVARDCPTPPAATALPRHPSAHVSRATTPSPARLPTATTKHSATRPEAFPAVSEGGGSSVSVEEFKEALMRCPEMLEAFGSQLAARFRYRHRPSWMAPILRAGGSGGD